MIRLTTHCGATGGSFGCDPGDLPAPPVAFAWLLFAVAALALLLGVYMVITGRLLLRFGKLKHVSTPRGTRLLGLALILDSFAGALIAQGTNLLSQHLEPPRWSEVVFVPLIILVAALQWLAFRIDRRPGPAPQ